MARFIITSRFIDTGYTCCYFFKTSKCGAVVEVIRFSATGVSATTKPDLFYHVASTSTNSLRFSRARAKEKERGKRDWSLFSSPKLGYMLQVGFLSDRSGSLMKCSQLSHIPMPAVVLSCESLYMRALTCDFPLEPGEHTCESDPLIGLLSGYCCIIEGEGERARAKEREIDWQKWKEARQRTRVQ